MDLGEPMTFGPLLSELQNTPANRTGGDGDMSDTTPTTVDDPDHGDHIDPTKQENACDNNLVHPWFQSQQDSGRGHHDMEIEVSRALHAFCKTSV